MGRAPAIVQLAERIHRVAKSGLSVLVVGETGVGKELVAREIHRIGGRMGPFEILDGATFEGPLQLSHHGTLFIDGIDELSPTMQAKLPRILADPKAPDVRIIAAAQGRATTLRETGRLRADLYYRVCETLIEIPPLRARGSDVRLLADHFLTRLGTSQQLTEAGYQALERYAWPGNVRELESVIRRAALLHEDRTNLGPECLFEHPATIGRRDVDLGRLLDGHWEQAKEEFARWYWTSVWQAFAGDRRRIAEHARVSDVWLRSRRKLYELQDNEPRMELPSESQARLVVSSQSSNL